MKTKLFYLLAFLVLSLGIKAQIINFPDANFKTKLLSASPSNTIAKDDSGNYVVIDTNNDGEIDEVEAQQIVELNISNANISSLDGLSYFALHSLNCSNNQISTLDISSFNLFSLDCSHNQLTSLDLSSLSYDFNFLNCSYNLLTNLQASSLSYLETLDCSHNQITSITLSPYLGGYTLVSINCSYNALTAFVLTDYTTYENLNCSNNQISVLDVKNKKINSLDCSNNQISELNFQDRKLQTLSSLNVGNNNFTNICKNEGDIFPSTGSVTQTICGNPVLGFDKGLKNVLLSSTLDACTYGYYNWVAKDISNNCLDLDSDLDGEMQQIDLDKVAYLQFFYELGGLINHNFVTTNGIQYLVNLKEIHGITGGTSSYTMGYLGSIVIDGLQNLEKIDLPQFFVKSIDIKNTPNLKKVFTGSPHSYGIGDALVYKFSNCPLLNEITGIKSNLTALTFQNCPNVKDIDVTGNRLTSFDASSLANLENLYLGNFRDYTNSSTEVVDFPKNTMTTLDISGHIKLKNFSCAKGSLTSLNIQNCSLLETVNCSSNDLTSLNVNGVIMNSVLPLYDPQFNGGINLYAYNNNLENIDFSNSKINKINVNNNQLKTLLLKNGFNETIQFDNNPNIKFICADETELNPIKTLVNQYGYTNTCNVNTYCSFNPGGNYNTITGTVRFDENNNGCDTSDEFFEHMKVKINDGTSTGETFVKSNGRYDFFTQSGDFTVTAEPENASLFTVTPSAFTTNFANSNNNMFTQNICVTKNGNAKDLEVVIAPVIHARPGFDADYKLIWRNKGNTTLSGSAILTFDNSRMSFVSSTLSSTVSGNQVIFNFNNLKPYASSASEIKFTINPPTHPSDPVNNGDILNFTANITPLSGDLNPEDNSFNYKETVVGSYDPNDITCLEGNQIPVAMVGKDLHYIVNFENTGTTSAVNIVVKMEINPDDFDINTLQLQNTSHNTYTKINGNKVEFMMKDINLAALAHGNIALKVKSKNNLVSGDSVINKANIYFDYNYPVETNEAITNIGGTTLSASDIIKGKETVNIYPNPTKGDVNISSDSKIRSVEIYDTQGRIIQKQIINSENAKVSIHDVASGMYIFKIKTEKETVTKKVIKN